MKHFSLFLLLLICGSSFAQRNLEKVSWNENKPLSWKDFRGEADANSTFHANSNTGITYSWRLNTVNGVVALEYEVCSNFYPDLSWVVAGSDNLYLLKHEQLHFDISELHARKLRKKLADLPISWLGKDPRTKLNGFYEKIDNERREMQTRFDRESQHSINKEAEAKWRKYVYEELEKYRNYKE